VSDPSSPTPAETSRLAAVWLAASGALPLALAMRCASYAPLGRDQGIFQYIAWAWSRGVTGYEQVRDVNGPLTVLVHMLLLALGGRDEHVFRVLELSISSLAFASAGFVLSLDVRAARGLRWQVRAAWSFAAWVILGAPYLRYIFWDLAQRESFAAWFFVPALALQVHAQRSIQQRGPTRGALGLLGLSGALGALPCLCKPTFVMLFFAQVLALLVDNELPISRPKRLGPFALGTLAGAGGLCLLASRYANLVQFAHISRADVPAMYQFIWPRTPWEVLSLDGRRTQNALALLTTVGMLAACARSALPRRYVAIALGPTLGLVAVIAQRKGFPYHFQFLTASLSLAWLALVMHLVSVGSVHRLLRAVAVVALCLANGATALGSPHLQGFACTVPPELPPRALQQAYRTTDFFPDRLRDLAQLLRERTAPGAKVFVYGMDPYLLFLADRPSASRFIYAYDLNCDAALAGSHLPAPEGLHPNAVQVAKIESLCAEHGSVLLRELEREAPAAVVLLDGSPLFSYFEGWTDLREHQPAVLAYIEAHYEEAANLSGYHLLLRK
jgi:hypothetical protein